MATFCNITVDEMRSFLKPEKGWREDGTRGEWIFNYELKANKLIQIKVYTGIKTDSGQSRGVGADAIRVCAVNVVTHQGWIKSVRVHRVQGWRANLQARVLKVIEQSNVRLRG